MVRFLWIGLILISSSFPLVSCEEKIEQTVIQGEDGYKRSPLKITTQDGRSLIFQVEIAKTPEKQSRGLMFRNKMAPDQGMIFIFPDEKNRSFWMRNTYLPLDIIFLKADGTIINIGAGIPLSEKEVLSDGPAKAAIELNKGTAARLGIRPGDKVYFPGLNS